MRQPTGSVFSGYMTQILWAIYSKSNFGSSFSESKVMTGVGFVHILNSSLCKIGLKLAAITWEWRPVESKSLLADKVQTYSYVIKFELDQSDLTSRSKATPKIDEYDCFNKVTITIFGFFFGFFEMWNPIGLIQIW